MFRSHENGLMKGFKAKPRVERALKTKEYTVLGAIRAKHERFKDALENWFYPLLPLKKPSFSTGTLEARRSGRRCGTLWQTWKRW